MDSYKETFETWNKVAKLYEERFMDLDLYNDTYDAFCEKLTKKDPTVLEVGCGPGNITKYLLSKRPDLIIEGIDISPNMIALAKTNNPPANFKVMDSRNIATIKRKYDAIVCGFCIPYFSESDLTKFIRNCKNLMSNNGILYLSFVEGEQSLSGFQTGSSGDRTFFYYHSLKKLEKELNKNSFTNIKVIHKTFIKRDRSEEVHTILLAEI